jgi:hypothetical protein
MMIIRGVDNNDGDDDGNPEDVEACIEILGGNLRQGMEVLRLSLPKEKRTFADIEPIVWQIVENQLGYMRDKYK